MPRSPAPRPSRDEPTLHLVPCPRQHVARAALEDLVARVFRAAYAAEVASFHDLLLGLRREDGTLLGVIGASELGSGNHQLVERYLGEPAEQALHRALAGLAAPPPRRDELIEIGNLASCSAGMGGRLIAAMARWQLARGRRWAVFASTAGLASTLSRWAPVVELGLARREALGEGGESWGRYYDTAPRVVAVDLQTLVARMAPPSCGAREASSPSWRGPVGEAEHDHDQPPTLRPLAPCRTERRSA